MDIQSIVENIENNKFILVLGPDLAYNSEKPLLREFSQFLESKRVKHEYHESEELLSSATKFKPLVFMNLPKFFNQLEVQDVHRQIAEIPFHLVISLSPDLLLKQAFDDKNKPLPTIKFLKTLNGLDKTEAF